MRIVSIDPGQHESAVIMWDGQEIFYRTILENQKVLNICVCSHKDNEVLVVEDIVSYAKMVGKSTFDTAYWTGRFVQSWLDNGGTKFEKISRRDIKIHFCQTIKGINDSSIRAALIDRFGGTGTKKNPGLTYGLKSHLWQAFALAVYAYDEWEKQQKGE